MNPDKIAEIVGREIQKRLDLFAKRAWYRGVVTSTNGQRADVKIEGSDEAMPNLLCIDSYTPTQGDEVLIANIGTTGANFIVMGSLTIE